MGFKHTYDDICDALFNERGLMPWRCPLCGFEVEAKSIGSKIEAAQQPKDRVREITLITRCAGEGHVATFEWVEALGDDSVP